MRNNNVTEFSVDLNNFELHVFTNVNIIITDWLHVDLRSWQECLDSKYINDQTTFRTTTNEASNNLACLQSLINTLPRVVCARCFVRNYKLTIFVFLLLDVNFHFITDFQIRIITEFVDRNDTLRFVTQVNHYFFFCDSNNRTFYNFFLSDSAKSFVVLVRKSFTFRGFVTSCV